MLALPSWLPSPGQVAIPVALLGSLLLVWRLDRPRGRWSSHLRERFLLGVPWGTLVSVCGVLAVYLFVQGGWKHWFNPVTLAFSSWSYLYPLGVVLAPFSHVGPGHVIGNLTTTLAVAPLAEYFVGHYGGGRGDNPFANWRTNPWIRAFVLFPLGVFAVGILTSVFAWGPIIGFSGVGFAFVGFALVRYPLATVVALTGQSVVQTAYYSLRNPVIVGSAGPGFSSPWWYGIAIQGHALGIVLGALLGVMLLHHRDERPSALRLWGGGVLAFTSLTLWAVWWYRGASTYVLYRGLGVGFVLTLAAVVALAATASDRPLVPIADDSSETAAASAAERATDPDGALLTVPSGPVTRRQVGVVALLIPLAIMAGVALPLNLTTVADAGVPGGGPAVEVNGYTVTYAEDVQNDLVSAVDVSLYGETTNVTTSGVIVVNEDRHIWSQEVSKSRLAFEGRAGVRVGGVGWAETVRVRRQGWSAVQGGTAYHVWLSGPEQNWTHAYASDPAVAGPTLQNNTVEVVPMNEAFYVQLTHNNTTVGSARIPPANQTVVVAGIRFERGEKTLYAAFDGTRVQIAKRETYN